MYLSTSSQIVEIWIVDFEHFLLWLSLWQMISKMSTLRSLIEEEALIPGYKNTERNRYIDRKMIKRVGWKKS